VVGEWWTLLILRDAFRGTRRFDDFHASLGMARSVLTARLRRLTEQGILERRSYTEHPPRYEYLLTEKGRALFPVITALLTWGDTWAPGPGGPPVVLVHDTCGHINPADADLPALPRRGQPGQHPQRARPREPGGLPGHDRLSRGIRRPRISWGVARGRARG